MSWRCFLGKVARVMPGIRAVFIDIGLKHDAFLHFSDIGERTEAFQSMLDEDNDLMTAMMTEKMKPNSSAATAESETAGKAEGGTKRV